MFQCKIVLDSIFDSRLTTFEVTFPWIILSEFRTHRSLSYSAASARAIPTSRLVQQVMEDPYVPVFTVRKSGMSGGLPLPDDKQKEMSERYLRLRNRMCREALEYSEICHKEHANRLLLPWAWQTMIVSGTDWENFFFLRNAKDAHPAFQIIAEQMEFLYRKSNPVERRDHVPYVHEEGDFFFRALLSAARIAKVSYINHNQTSSIGEEQDFAFKLINSRHWSPLEHQAVAYRGRHGNFSQWMQFRKCFSGENVSDAEYVRSSPLNSKPHYLGLPMNLY